jgi:chromosome segregation ATPase
MKEVDCKCIISDCKKTNDALRAERDGLATDKAEYKEAAKIFSRRLTKCEQERDKLKKRVSSYEFDYAKRHSKYEHVMTVLEQRTEEVANQNKEILALRDTIEALKFDRDVAMNKLDKTVEPTTRADKMRERVKCELCGKDLSRNSLRAHMKKMHIADGDDDDDVSTTCLSGVD